MSSTRRPTRAERSSSPTYRIMTQVRGRRSSSRPARGHEPERGTRRSCPREVRGHAQVTGQRRRRRRRPRRSRTTRARLTRNLFSSASSAKRSVIGCCESEFSSGGVERRWVLLLRAAVERPRFARSSQYEMKHPTTTPLVLNMINRGVVKAPHMTREAFRRRTGRTATRWCRIRRSDTTPIIACLDIAVLGSRDRSPFRASGSERRRTGSRRL